MDIDSLSKTIKAILYAKDNDGLYSSIVTGKRGIGKSSYSLQILFMVFRALGYDVETAWEMALERILYEIKEVVKFLDDCLDSNEKGLCIWDDAGVYAGGVRWLTDQKEMVLIESICDTFRDCLYCILFTVPDHRTLSRRLRSYDDKLGKIQNIKPSEVKTVIELYGKNDLDNIRAARIYNKVVLPSTQVRIYKSHTDFYNIMLPDWVYKRYKEKRKKYTKSNVKRLLRQLQAQGNED